MTNQKEIDIMCPFIQHELTHAAAEKNIIYLLATAAGQNNGCTTLSTHCKKCQVSYKTVHPSNVLLRHEKRLFFRRFWTTEKQGQ